jgi:ketosteroid isomerase-like protein
VPTPSPDVAAIEATLADFAAAFSNKNLDGVTSLWPTMPAAARNGLRDAFRNRDYSVLYSLQPVGAPVIQGDRAQIGARRTVEALLQPGNRRDRQGPTAVTVFLQKTGGRWVITDLQ